MKNGNAFLNEKAFSALPPAFFAFAVRHRASTRVMGMIASVRVSFTVTAEDKIPSTP